MAEMPEQETARLAVMTMGMMAVTMMMVLWWPLEGWEGECG